MPDKIPIYDEKDLNLLLKDTLNNKGVLVAPKEFYQMVIKLPGVSITQKPRKDGRYQGYMTENGVKHYVYGSTREEVARRILLYLKHGAPKRIRRRQPPANAYGVPETFNAFATYYFENFRKKRVSEKTLYSDLGRYNKYLKPYFKETPIKKISPKACQTLIDDISDRGKGKTADEIFSLLSVILKMAIKHDIIKNNPLDIVYHVQHERKHGKALTKQEENALKTALNGSILLSSYMILLYTGLRPNELKTAKIDGNFVIAVNSKRKNGKTEYKKIPICKMLAPYVQNAETVYLASVDHLRRKIRDILPGHILYDLRTTFYSRLKECDVSENAINAFMGHSLGALGNAYTDLSDDFLIKEMQKFDY